jgi:ABC-2 type transport system permease protein
MWQVVEVVSGVILLVVGLAGVDHSIGVFDSAAFGLALLVGGVLVYCFWLIMTTGAFWIVRMENVLELFEGIYQTGRWPVTVYPGWLRYSVTFLIPIGFAVTVPAQALTSRLHWPTLALAVAFGCALFAFTRWFWRFGLRHYSGASA